jgi:hypothetical protein
MLTNWWKNIHTSHPHKCIVHFQRKTFMLFTIILQSLLFFNSCAMIVDGGYLSLKNILAYESIHEQIAPVQEWPIYCTSVCGLLGVAC